jgi:hypothetical protein
MPSSTEPIRILGAGPSGLVAALTLARSGREVVVFERGKRVGGRFAGDLHGVENWSQHADWRVELERMGVAIDFECQPWRQLYLSNGRWIKRLESKRPLFYLVERGHGPGSLEGGLLEQARSHGVKVQFEQTLPANEATIAATGPDPGRVFIVEKGLLFRTSAPDLAVGLIDRRCPGKGYSYLLIRNGRGCLCSVLFDRFEHARRTLEQSLETLSRQFQFTVEEPRSIGGVGAFRHPPRFLDGSTLRAGEAAGVQDFLFGFGIRSAMRSGQLVARSLIEEFDYLAQATATFEPPARAGVVSRLLWRNIGLRASGIFVHALLRSRHPRRALRFAYGFNPIYRQLYRFGVRSAVAAPSRQRNRSLTSPVI